MRQAERHGAIACSVPDLLKRDDVDIVLNLSIPEAHAEVSLAALESGKHVYSEKPLATTVADGASILDAARARERAGHDFRHRLSGGARSHRRGCHRPASVRHRSDHVSRHGALASNPGFLFRKGAGPVLDMGPYYIPASSACSGPSHRSRL